MREEIIVDGLLKKYTKGFLKDLLFSCKTRTYKK